MKRKWLSIFLMLTIIGMVACNHKNQETTTEETTAKQDSTAKQPTIYKGLYSLGPDAKTFKNCSNGREYWVGDSTNTLELKYWEIIPHEMPEKPVYLEAEANLILSNHSDDGGHGDAPGYDSTLVVKKIIKIAKDIPAGMCKN